MKKRLLTIFNIFIVSVYMILACACSNENSGIGSEAIEINPDGSAKEESSSSNLESTVEESIQEDPYDYLTPALEILGWKCVNNVAANKAIDLISQALLLDDSLADAYKARGSAYLCLGDSLGNFDSAEADFIKVQDIEPDNPDGYLGQAEILVRKGKAGEAVELFEKAKELIAINASSENNNNKDANSDTSAELVSSTDSDLESDTVSDSESATDSDLESATDSYSESDTDSDLKSDTDSDLKSDTVSESESDTVSESDTDTDTDTDSDLESDSEEDPGTINSIEVRYNSGISDIFMQSEDDIQNRIDEIKSDSYSDSTGRVRYKKIFADDGTVAESVFYACYLYGEYEPNIIVSYDANGLMIATAFNLFEGTDSYVYGMYTSSDTWNVCIPMWSEYGIMTGVVTYYGGSIIAYEMYLYDAEQNMIGAAQYNSSMTLENTVIFDGYLRDDAVNDDEVAGTALYSIEDIYDLIDEYIERESE